jgi:hypothetical protein
MSWKGDDSIWLLGIKAVEAGLNILRFLSVRNSHLLQTTTARSFGGLRMTVKVGEFQMFRSNLVDFGG